MVFKPLLFIQYTADISKVIRAHDLLHHSYADDNQVYALCALSNSDNLKLKNRLHRRYRKWMASNCPKFNPQIPSLCGVQSLLPVAITLSSEAHFTYHMTTSSRNRRSGTSDLVLTRPRPCLPESAGQLVILPASTNPVHSTINCDIHGNTTRQRFCLVEDRLL